jgi:hypothetical protein
MITCRTAAALYANHKPVADDCSSIQQSGGKLSHVC